jgi:hypothetical protein
VNEQQSARIRYLEGLFLAGGQGSLPKDFSGDHLEAIQSSPEPEHLVPLTQVGWTGVNPASSMLVFEPSPTDASSGPDAQRSTPLSTGSPETDGKDAVVWGLMDFDEQRLADQAMDPQPRARKDSQNELQASLSQMELDGAMDGHRPWGGF